MRLIVRGELNKTVLICVDSYDEHVPTGDACILFDEDCFRFNSLSQLIIGINNRFDLDNDIFPQSFTHLKKFRVGSEQDGSSYTVCPRHKGRVATFSILLICRQNSSWQGQITWLEKSKKENFRSVLELIMILDSALSAVNNLNTNS